MPVSRRIREKARTSLKKEKNHEKNKKIIGSFVYRRPADDVELLRRNVTAFGRLPAASAARTGMVSPPAETGAAPSDTTAPASSGTALVAVKNAARPGHTLAPALKR